VKQVNRPATTPKSGAQRTAEWRSRKKRGKIQLKIEADPGDTADNLADLGFLEQWAIEGIDPDALGIALTAAVALRKKLKV
jgi:hypothetical protein